MSLVKKKKEFGSLFYIFSISNVEMSNNQQKFDPKLTKVKKIDKKIISCCILPNLFIPQMDKNIYR